MIADTSRSPWAKAWSISFADVEWAGGLYRERFDTVAAVTVPHLQRMFEEKDISHVVENFRIAAGVAEGDFAGTVFGDGDFYKWFEAAVYTAVRTQNAALLDQLEDYIALFARAQQPDGYLSTKQIIGEKQGKGPMRQGDINDFEVYNMGHMFTSACLYFRLTGKDSFLRVAEGAARYLRAMYGEAARTGEVKTAVCPSHYMGLIELYRTTGKREYLELAQLAVQLRDSVQNGLDDNQDRLPLKRHRSIVGHAVRANYLYAGLADLYMESGDWDYLELLWGQSRTEYITSYCCPPNLARTLAQTAEYAYAVDETGVWTGLYGESKARFKLRNGAEFTLTQKTGYPFDGRIEIAVSDSNGISFQLRLRIPHWARGAMLSCGEAPLEPGYTVVNVERPEGFACALELPFAPRMTVGHDLIEESRNQAAVEVGPLVYCLETAGLPAGVRLPDVLLPMNPDFVSVSVEIDGRRVPAWEVTLLNQPVAEGEREALYRTLEPQKLKTVRARLIPYYAWDNRGWGEMTVWLPLAWREV